MKFKHAKDWTEKEWKKYHAWIKKQIHAGAFVDKDGVPHCPQCNKIMINTIDSKTKEISKYLWKTTCEHSKDLVLSMG